MNSIKNKKYYFNENKTKIVTFIIWFILMPINIYFYNKEFYGGFIMKLSDMGKGMLTDGLDIILIFAVAIISFLINIKKQIEIKL